MAAVKYRLVDGPFLYRLAQDVANIISDSEFRLNLANLSGGAHRVIYYDALPVKKKDQSKEDFEKAEADKLDFLNEIRSHAAYQVRDGLTRLKTKSSGRKVAEVLEQKGVDTWIAVDAVRLAFTGIADEIEIITSDSDLYPAFEAIQMTKARGTLIYEVGRAPQELIHAADFGSPISINQVAHWIGCDSVFQAGTLMLKRRTPLKEAKEFKFGKFDFHIERGSSDFIADKVFDGTVKSCLKARNVFSMIDWINQGNEWTSWKKIADEICSAFELKSAA